jgi:hypothetical protein
MAPAWQYVVVFLAVSWYHLCVLGDFLYDQLLRLFALTNLFLHDLAVISVNQWARFVAYCQVHHGIWKTDLDDADDEEEKDEETKNDDDEAKEQQPEEEDEDAVTVEKPKDD